MGASGSGTTTLGHALAEQLNCLHLDTDDYYWLSTDPPFRKKRPTVESQALLRADLSKDAGFVLSGSLCGWGDIFIPSFDLVVFLWLPSQFRLARLKERERLRYGEDTIAPGGLLYKPYIAFMTWAEAYDDGGMQMRSRQRHEQWLKNLTCPALRLEGCQQLEVSVSRIVNYLSTMSNGCG